MVFPDFIVQVTSGRAAGGADKSYRLTGLDFIALLDQYFGQMAI